MKAANSETKTSRIYTTPTGEKLFTVGDVMDEMNIKSRATVDKYVHLGVLNPLRKRGRPHKDNRGRRFLFKQEAVERLKKHLQKKTGPKGVVLATSKKDDIILQLNEAIKKMEHLEQVVKELKKDVKSTRVVQ